MRDDIKSLKAAESGGDGVLGVIIVAIALSLFLAFFVASPGGDDEPARSTPVTTATASRQQAQRPASQPETAVIVATVTIQSGSTRPASRPSQGDSTPVPATVVPTWTPQPTYTPYPTSTPVPTAVPSQTPLPTYTAVATYTPYPTLTAVPTATRPPVMAAMPMSTPPAPSGGNSDTWLIAGMVICAVLVAILAGGILLSYRSYRPLIINNAPLPPAPQRQVLPPPIGEPVRELVKPVKPVTVTSFEPVQPGMITMSVTPVEPDIDEQLMEKLWSIWKNLPNEGKGQSYNAVCFAMWGGKNPQRLTMVKKAVAWGEERERQKRLDQTVVNRASGSTLLGERVRNRPPMPTKRPFSQPVKGVEG